LATPRLRPMSTFPAPRFLFFDVGNVLVSDDPSGLFIYRRLYEHLGGEAAQSPEAFFDDRTRLAADGVMLWSFVKQRVGDRDFEAFQEATRRDLYSRWEEHSPEIPGMAAALRGLAAEGWRMGILANQPPEVEGLLRARGLWDLFEVQAVSEVLGAAKPDPRIFTWALGRAGVEAGEALMIGDRMDNDIAPARALGMRSLLLRVSYEDRGWRPSDRFGELYVRSMKAQNISGVGPRDESEQPDWVADSPEEMAEVVRRLKLKG
jgi:HAD superfamily hydrolase (TIGR01509 family)